jgi:hypothetical protein
MRKRNTPIRMIAVRPVQPRSRMVFALLRRFVIGADARRAAADSSASLGHARLRECLDLDQRVREVGEW